MNKQERMKNIKETLKEIESIIENHMDLESEISSFEMIENAIEFYKDLIKEGML